MFHDPDSRCGTRPYRMMAWCRIYDIAWTIHPSDMNSTTFTSARENTATKGLATVNINNNNNP
jgi:hypothetical protein